MFLFSGNTGSGFVLKHLAKSGMDIGDCRVFVEQESYLS